MDSFNNFLVLGFNGFILLGQCLLIIFVLGALTDIYVFKLVFTEDAREDKSKLIETARFISSLLASMGLFLVAVFYISEVSPVRLIRFSIVTNLILSLFLTIIMRVGQSKESKLKLFTYI